MPYTALCAALEGDLMKHIDRMIAQAVLWATGMVVSVFLVLNVLIELVSQLNYLDTGQYHIWQMLAYVLLLMPYRVILFFPVACLLGSVVGLNHLASMRALVVIRTSGVSVHQIGRAVLLGILPFLLIVLCLGEGWGPKAEAYGKYLRLSWMSNGHIHNHQKAYWWRDGQAFFHAVASENGKNLKRIMRFTLNADERILQEDTARSAAFGAHAWTLKQLRSSMIGQNKVHGQSKQTARWKTVLTPAWLALSNVPPEKQNLVDLIGNLQFRQHNNLESQSLNYAFWRRFLQPINCLLMGLMGLPFVMGPLRERGSGVRVGAAVLFGVGAYVLGQFLGPLTLLLRLPPFAAAVAPALLLSVLVKIFLRRVR